MGVLLLDDVLREPLEDAARFSGAAVLPFRQAAALTPGLPVRVLRYRREGNLPLLSYLRTHQNKPTEVPGGKPRGYLHDCVRDDIWSYPEGAGFEPYVHSFREVELLLRPENQLDLQLKGEERKWPLTVVDNIIYDSSRHQLSLIGVISDDIGELREREIKPLIKASRFFGYNWGVVPDLYLALPGDPAWLVPIEGARVPKRYQGVFKERTF